MENPCRGTSAFCLKNRGSKNSSKIRRIVQYKLKQEFMPSDSGQAVFDWLRKIIQCVIHFLFRFDLTDFRSSGLTVFRSSGLTVFRSSGLTVFREAVLQSSE
ncbi:hypothetical protein CEXT_263621 [Caerostris extrusa]|uniref:Uncharacterized protein n=1 Tax=Caerostris extrusa TaxID=172846 RepID=A0AAV4W3N1_CAEEX|nr:hypothetical protein CEXT_263621 [Caerostris extrusa]